MLVFTKSSDFARRLFGIERMCQTMQTMQYRQQLIFWGWQDGRIDSFFRVFVSSENHVSIYFYYWYVSEIIVNVWAAKKKHCLFGSPYTWPGFWGVNCLRFGGRIGVHRRSRSSCSGAGWLRGCSIGLKHLEMRRSGELSSYIINPVLSIYLRICLGEMNMMQHEYLISGLYIPGTQLPLFWLEKTLFWGVDLQK